MYLIVGLWAHSNYIHTHTEASQPAARKYCASAKKTPHTNTQVLLNCSATLPQVISLAFRGFIEHAFTSIHIISHLLLLKPFHAHVWTHEPTHARTHARTHTHRQPLVVSYLVIECTHVQGRVSRGILGAHVGAIEEQVFQVLHVAMATSLHIKTGGTLTSYYDLIQNCWHQLIDDR